MEAATKLLRLEELAHRLDVTIERTRPVSDEFRAKGGLCRIRGAYHILIDSSEPLDTQVEVLVKGLAGFDTDDMYLVPFVREMLDAARAEGKEG